MAMNQFIYSETPERVEILKWNLKFRVVVSEMDWVWARLRRLRRDERLNWLQVVSYKGSILLVNHSVNIYMFWIFLMSNDS